MFIVHPTPSPTSTLNINLRYYELTNEETGESYRIDIGTLHEEMLETLYEMTADHLRPIEYEKLVRALFTERYQFLLGAFNFHVVLSMANNDFEDIKHAEEQQLKSVQRLARKLFGRRSSLSLPRFLR